MTPKTLIWRFLRKIILIDKKIQIEHRTSSLATKMDKIDAFTDSMASNRADISELKGAFSETTRVQTELREIQNNLIGNFSEAQIF